MRSLNEEEIEPAISMMLGKAFPKYDSKTIDVSWVTLSSIIKHLSGVKLAEFNHTLRSTGDVGEATKMIFERLSPGKQPTLIKKPLTILEVRRIFEHIVEFKGQWSKDREERLIETLFSRAVITSRGQIFS